MYQWDDDHQTWVDYMGLPLTRTELIGMRELVRQALTKTPAQLARDYNDILLKQHPDQFEQHKKTTKDME